MTLVDKKFEDMIYEELEKARIETWDRWVWETGLDEDRRGYEEIRKIEEYLRELDSYLAYLDVMDYLARRGKCKDIP